jgi:DNA-binding transcriptional ArsR family regulator
MVDARTFQALSDPTRLKILSLLGNGSMNVSSMVEKLDVTQPAVSRHLKVLREAGLIVDARNGKWVEYSSNPSTVAEAAEYLKALNNAAAVRPGSGPAPERMPKVRKRRRPAAALAKAGAPTPPESKPPEKTEEADQSQYVVERDEDFIDDLML